MNNDILSFEQAGLRSETGWLVQPVSFRAAPGEAVWFRVNPDEELLPLGDLATGILEPTEGTVSFLGRSWRDYAPGEAAAGRGRIGRVFKARGLISNLDVDENITLPQRHHTARPEEEIVREAEALAKRLGFEELPRRRPALMKPGDVRRAEWVRAFLGQPALIVLEEPMLDVYDQYLPALMQEMTEACRRGAAVLWISSEAPPAGWQPARRYRVEGGEIRPMENEV